MSMARASYSMRATPRPSPMCSSASVMTLSIARSSAKRTGSYQGSTTTAVPSPRPGQAAATWLRKSSGEGEG